MALENLKTFSSVHIIEKIYEKLVDFRGNDFFDDDICMICFEVE